MGTHSIEKIRTTPSAVQRRWWALVGRTRRRPRTVHRGSCWSTNWTRTMCSGRLCSRHEYRRQRRRRCRYIQLTRTTPGCWHNHCRARNLRRRRLSCIVRTRTKPFEGRSLRSPRCGSTLHRWGCRCIVRTRTKPFEGRSLRSPRCGSTLHRWGCRCIVRTRTKPFEGRSRLLHMRSRRRTALLPLCKRKHGGASKRAVRGWRRTYFPASCCRISAPFLYAGFRFNTIVPNYSSSTTKTLS